MIKEGKYCANIMEKHFHKEFMMTKEDDEDFENSTKLWFVIMFMLRVKSK